MKRYNRRVDVVLRKPDKHVRLDDFIEWLKADDMAVSKTEFNGQKAVRVRLSLYCARCVAEATAIERIRAKLAGRTPMEIVQLRLMDVSEIVRTRSRMVRRSKWTINTFGVRMQSVGLLDLPCWIESRNQSAPDPYADMRDYATREGFEFNLEGRGVRVTGLKKEPGDADERGRYVALKIIVAHLCVLASGSLLWHSKSNLIRLGSLISPLLFLLSAILLVSAKLFSPSSSRSRRFFLSVLYLLVVAGAGACVSSLVLTPRSMLLISLGLFFGGWGIWLWSADWDKWAWGWIAVVVPVLGASWPAIGSFMRRAAIEEGLDVPVGILRTGPGDLFAAGMVPTLGQIYILFLLMGTIGWLRYFSVHRIAPYYIGILVAIMAIVSSSTFMWSMHRAEKEGAALTGQLANGKTFDGDVMIYSHYACIRKVEDHPAIIGGSLPAPGRAVVVFDTNDDRVWFWDDGVKTVNKVSSVPRDSVSVQYVSSSKSCH